MGEFPFPGQFLSRQQAYCLNDALCQCQGLGSNGRRNKKWPTSSVTKDVTVGKGRRELKGVRS